MGVLAIPPLGVVNTHVGKNIQGGLLCRSTAKPLVELYGLLDLLADGLQGI